MSLSSVNHATSVAIHDLVWSGCKLSKYARAFQAFLFTPEHAPWMPAMVTTPYPCHPSE